MRTNGMAIVLVALCATVNAIAALPVDGGDFNRQHIVVPLPKDVTENDEGDWEGDDDLHFKHPQVAISIFAVKISPTLAAEWGLDGGPAAKPETTPLKGDIPKCMTKEQMRTLITALRKHKETEILGSSSTIVRSGFEAYSSIAKEIMYPESFDDGNDVEFQEADEDEEDEDQDEDDDDFVPPQPVKAPRKKIRRSKPKRDTGKFDLNGLVPVFGPGADGGVTLTVTSQANALSKVIELDLHTDLVVDKAVDSPLPMFSHIELRTLVTLKSGQSMILSNGIPGVFGDYHKYVADAATDRRPYLLFLSAELVEIPEEDKPDDAKALGEQKDQPAELEGESTK